MCVFSQCLLPCLEHLDLSEWSDHYDIEEAIVTNTNCICPRYTGEVTSTYLVPVNSFVGCLCVA